MPTIIGFVFEQTGKKIIYVNSITMGNINSAINSLQNVDIPPAKPATQPAQSQPAVPQTSLQSPVVVGFEPTALYYYSTSPPLGLPAGTNVSCNSLPKPMYDPSWDTSCNMSSPTGSPFLDSSYNCYVRQICINKDKSDKLADLQNKHSGSNENYADANATYNQTLTNTYNLIGGIVGISVIMYYS